jgi:hypothetical protein
MDLGAVVGVKTALQQMIELQPESETKTRIAVQGSYAQRQHKTATKYEAKSTAKT